MRSTKPREGWRKAAGRRVLLRLVLFAALAGGLGAINLTVSGSWSAAIDVSNLQGGAGSDLIPSLESPLNVSTLSVSQASGQNWQVSVRKIDGTWPAGLAMAVKRTSNGTGSGTIAGGTAYLNVTSVDQTFFTGYGGHSTIYLCFQLSGLSVQIPPSAYSTTLVYTVVQTI
jgi:hypothetical protein